MIEVMNYNVSYYVIVETSAIVTQSLLEKRSLGSISHMGGRVKWYPIKSSAERCDLIDYTNT